MLHSRVCYNGSGHCIYVFTCDLLANLNIKIRTVAPYSHQSLHAEHGIKSLSTILTKQPTNLGQM